MLVFLPFFCYGYSADDLVPVKWHPLVDLHGGVGNLDPFLLPVSYFGSTSTPLSHALRRAAVLGAASRVSPCRPAAHGGFCWARGTSSKGFQIRICLSTKVLSICFNHNRVNTIVLTQSCYHNRVNTFSLSQFYFFIFWQFSTKGQHNIKTGDLLFLLCKNVLGKGQQLHRLLPDYPPSIV